MDDARETLEALARVPITAWNYTGEAPGVRHMGPMAQDLYASFGLGADDKSICTVDADGIAFAAIQGLHEETRALRRENADLKAALADQGRRLEALEARAK
ncbi:MAG: hypothetical protein NTW86_27535 [Candidatus Sumerlaeota bacterium]|nr:hypothetical protein [Candidatus Sumerlaeota bacterium]